MKLLSVFVLLLLACVCMGQQVVLKPQQPGAGWKSEISFAITTDVGEKRTDNTLSYKTEAAPGFSGEASVLEMQTEGPFGSTAEPAVRKAEVPYRLTPAGMELLPFEGKLFIGGNTAPDALVPQLRFPEKPVTSISEVIARVSDRTSDELRMAAAACRWNGTIINPFSGTRLEAAFTLSRRDEQYAYITAFHKAPDPKGKRLTAGLLDELKKQQGSRFILSYRDYEGSADVSFSGYYVYDMTAGQTAEARENYYITGTLIPKGTTLSVTDAREKFLYITIAINITHKITEQGVQNVSNTDTGQSENQ